MEFLSLQSCSAGLTVDGRVFDSLRENQYVRTQNWWWCVCTPVLEGLPLSESILCMHVTNHKRQNQTYNQSWLNWKLNFFLQITVKRRIPMSNYSRMDDNFKNRFIRPKTYLRFAWALISQRFPISHFLDRKPQAYGINHPHDVKRQKTSHERSKTNIAQL